MAEVLMTQTVPVKDWTPSAFSARSRYGSSHWSTGQLHASWLGRMYTGKKENEIFFIYREIQIRGYMRKGFLIYEEMRKYLTIYEEAVSHIWLCTLLNFLIYEENLISFFISVAAWKGLTTCTRIPSNLENVQQCFSMVILRIIWNYIAL